MTNRPQPANLLCQFLVELNRRMEEKVAVRKAHYRHPGRERKRQPDSAYSQIFEWAIDDADVRREWLVDVNWLVSRGTHVADHQDAGECRKLQHSALASYAAPKSAMPSFQRVLAARSGHRTTRGKSPESGRSNDGNQAARPPRSAARCAVKSM